VKVVRSNEGDEKSNYNSTGPATLRPQLTRQKKGGLQITMVSFSEGARTNWHDHPGEQALYILSGKGRVGNGDEEWEVKPGDIIYTDAGEKHWHGAFPGEKMTHLSITTVGAPNWYDESPED
jgi:quercetin dioxygenase-like cupin family protein